MREKGKTEAAKTLETPVFSRGIEILTEKIKLYYTESEAKIILRSLIRLKNELIRQGRYADIVDEVILLLVDAKIKRVRV